MSQKLKIGVIGASGRGKLARNAHRPERGVELVAGADINPDALEDFRKAMGDGVFTTSDYRQLLQRPELDAVFVCSPDFLHEEHAVAALEAGKAVYLEKPIAISIEGCDRILRTAYETGSKLYVGHNMRHFPVILKMKEIIDSGLIGEVQSVWCRHFISYGGDAYFRDWHSEQQFSTGLLLQKGAHDIDVIHWLAGGYTSAVNGMGKLSVYNRCQRRSSDQKGSAKWSDQQWPPLEQTGFSPVIDVEDHSMILMQLDNGVQASYLQSHYTPDSCRNYTFIGTKGRIENIGDYGRCKVIVYTQRNGSGLGPDLSYDIKPLEGSHGGADPLIVGEFLDFLQHGTQTNTSPVAARFAVAAGVMGTRSIREGNGLQTLPELDQELIEYFTNGQSVR